MNFNPRSHEGSDEEVSRMKILVWISIHAPTRGATPYALVLAIIEYISIHAPTRGATFAFSAI